MKLTLISARLEVGKKLELVKEIAHHHHKKSKEEETNHRIILIYVLYI